MPRLDEFLLQNNFQCKPNSTPREDKVLLRKILMATRRELAQKRGIEAGALHPWRHVQPLLEGVRETHWGKIFDTLCVYAAMRGEWEWSDDVRWGAWYPRVEGTHMLWGKVWGPDDLQISPPWGIREPLRAAPFAQGIPRAVAVPALAVDERGVRLGYGGGFYDRFLELHEPWSLTFAMVDAGLVFDALPHEPWDIAVDLVATERGAFWTPKGQAKIKAPLPPAPKP